MTKLTKILSGLLVLQLLLAISFWWNSQKSQRPVPAIPLLAEETTVDRVVVESAERTITLIRTGEHWQFEDSSLPVEAHAIDQLLQGLRSQTTSWPVSANRSSHARFEVSDDKFQRRVKLYQGDQLAVDLVLGTSPAFRQLHLRRAGEDNVYRVPLAMSDFSPTLDHWLDNDLLAAGEVTALETETFRLERSPQGWHLARGELPEGREFNPDRAAELASHLTHLRVIDPFTEEAEVPEVLSLRVETPAGHWTYQFYQNNRHYLIKRNDREQLFRTGRFQLRQIVDITLEELSKEPDGGEELDAPY